MVYGKPFYVSYQNDRSCVLCHITQYKTVQEKNCAKYWPIVRRQVCVNSPYHCIQLGKCLETIKNIIIFHGNHHRYRFTFFFKISIVQEKWFVFLESQRCNLYVQNQKTDKECLYSKRKAIAFDWLIFGSMLCCVVLVVGMNTKDQTESWSGHFFFVLRYLISI